MTFWKRGTNRALPVDLLDIVRIVGDPSDKRSFEAQKEAEEKSSYCYFLFRTVYLVIHNTTMKSLLILEKYMKKAIRQKGENRGLD